MKAFFSLFLLLMSINLLAQAPQMAPSLSYQELQKIKSTPPYTDAYFGYSVAIDGNTAVIGAYGFNSIAGEAYIYQYDEVTKMFLEKAVLTTSSLNSGDYFGRSVAISGDTVIIGAWGDREINTGSGAAYIYEKPFLSAWVDTTQYVAKLKASDANSSDNFGYSVSISGDTVIVGALYDDETNSNSGAAYIYEKPIGGWSDTAQEDAKLKASDADSSDNFGRSVAIGGDTVIIGADGDDEISTRSGAAYIYEKPIDGWSDTAQEDAKLKASDAGNFDYYGYSVAINDNTVVIGSYNDDENLNSGAAYIYEKPIDGWSDTAQEDAKLKASDADNYDYFGISVAISGDMVFVGAYGDDEINIRSGAAYIYKKPSSGIWVNTTQEDAKLKASDADSDDHFGVSVAISGDTLLIGAHRDDDSGAIYIGKVRNTPSNAAVIMYLLQ